MKRFVYNQKYAKLLIELYVGKCKIEELAKKHSINTGHLRTVLDQWTREEVIIKERVGKEYLISLSEKGSKISNILGQLIQIVDKKEQPEVITNENKPSNTV